MAITAEDFLKKFYSLDGLTIAERRRNFFKLLDENALHLKSNVDVLDAISSDLKPRTHLESLFRVDFLIYFRRKQELLQILKEGNSIFVSKVTKQIWFFKEAFEDISANEIVDEILPSMSFSVRMKVLSKLSRYLGSQKFNKIYDCIAIRYGTFIASRFITGCDPVKVRTILVENRVKLNSTQLRILHGKDRELIEFYFCNTNNFIHNYKTFIDFLYNNDRALFNQLQEKYKFSFKLGRRATKKFADGNKNDVIKNAHLFNHIDMKAFIRKIGKDSVQLFINNVYFSRKECFYNSTKILQSFPKRYHYSLYIKTYQNHFNIKLEDYPSLINEDILKLIPTDNERAILAKVKVDEGHDKYMKYLLPAESIPLIKEKINLTSDIRDRGNLIEWLIETCHINKDLDSLYSVMKYFCFRHKNDELSVHLQFISNIEKLFGFKQFTEEMWNCLNELLAIHMLKFDQSDTTYQKIQTSALVSFNLGISTDQKLSYLEFLFKKGESIDELLREYFSTSGTFPCYSKYDKTFGKYFLLFAINNIAKESFEDENLSFNCSLINQIDYWNSSFEDDKLSFYDFSVLVNTFNHVLRKKDDVRFRYSHLHEIFRSKIFTTKENPYKNEYLQLYWERHDEYFNLDDVKWFLKYEPLIVLTNFETIFPKLCDESSERRPSRCSKYSRYSRYSGRIVGVDSIWYVLKKFSHLKLDQKSIETVLAKLNDESCLERKPKFIFPLSILMKPSDYGTLADSYKPENKKLDLKNEKEVRLYNLQCAIATQFKNTKTFEVLSSLLNYCAGDYFKYALRSLYSLLYRTPENQLPQYLNYLSKKAVSVRKHALYMTCELCTCTKVENMLRLLNKQEDVQSLQKYMFSSTIQYFVKNPSDSFFELVKLNMMFITKADEESLSTITVHLNKIPQNYKGQYLTYAWEHLEKTVDVWKKLSTYKHSILSSVDVTTAKDIPLDLAFKIIQQHFMTNEANRDLTIVTSFMYDLLRAKNEKKAIFEKIFSIVDRPENKKQVFDLFDSWYLKIMNCSEGNLEFWQPLVVYYEKKVKMIEHFVRFIKIFLLKLKIKCVYLSADDLAEKILSFYEEVLNSCGPHVISLFTSEINSNLKYLMRSGEKNIYFYHCMLKRRPEAAVASFVMQVLPASKSRAGFRYTPTYGHYEDSEIFDQILEILKGIGDIGIQINLHWKFEKFLKEEPEKMQVEEDNFCCD